LALLAVLAATQVAGAQEARHRLGLQAHFAMPTGATMYIPDGEYDPNGDKWLEGFLSMGFGASATFEWGISNSGSVRASLEYLAFGDSTIEQASNFEGIQYVYKKNYGIQIVGFAADYAYSFKSLDAGPYVFGGLGYYSTSGSGLNVLLVEMPPFQGVEDLTPTDGNGSSLGFSIGGGYRFTKNLGCELKFTQLSGLKQTIKYGPGADPGEEDPKQKIDLGWLQVSLCYRF
jgi:hypothetical protein